jgi:hypothetical protein
MKKQLDLIKRFCYIQLQVLKDRELRLRKEMQECKIQKEFISGTISEIERSTNESLIKTEEN